MDNIVEVFVQISWGISCSLKVLLCLAVLQIEGLRVTQHVAEVIGELVVNFYDVHVCVLHRVHRLLTIRDAFTSMSMDLLHLGGSLDLRGLSRRLTLLRKALSMLLDGCL